MVKGMPAHCGDETYSSFIAAEESFLLSIAKDAIFENLLIVKISCKIFKRMVLI